MRIFTVKNKEGQTFEVKEEKLGEAEKDGFLPVVSNSEGFEHRVSMANMDKAVADGFNPVYRGDFSKTESALRGAAQGVTAGFSDEIVGGAKGLLSDFKSLFTGNNPDSPIVRDEHGRVISGGEGSVYQKERDLEREKNKLAEEANPGSYMGGQVIGGIATLAVPGGAALKGATGLAKLGRGMTIGAAEGAAYGAGESEAETLGGLVKDTAVGGTVGAVVPVGIAGAGKVAKKAKDVVEKLGQKEMAQNTAKYGAAIFGDMPTEIGEKIIKNPEKFNTSKSVSGIKDDIINTVNNLQGEISELDTIAWNTLSKNKEIPVSNLKSEINELLNNTNAFIINESGERVASSQAQVKRAMKKVDDIFSDLDAYGSNLSESDLKGFIKRAQGEIDWSGKPENSFSNSILSNIEGHLNNLLKTRNTQYANAMRPVQERTSLTSDIANAFSLKRKEGRFIDTDSTLNKVQKLQTASGETKKEISEALLDKLGKHREGGQSFVDDIFIARANKATEGGLTQGSKNILGGAAIGGVTAGPVGVVIGATSGFVKDKYGRAITKKALQTASPYLQKTDKILSKLPTMPQKYQNIFADASRRGGNAVAVSHFLLSGKDPEYKKLMSEYEEEE